MDSEQDFSLDARTVDGLSCYSSTLIGDDSSTLAGEPRLVRLGDAEREWYRELSVSEMIEVSLKKLNRKNGGYLLVLLLRDSSLCCLGPEDDDESLGDSVAFTSSCGARLSWYPSSRLPQLDEKSTTLVELSFSHQPRDLAQVLQIRQCAQSNLDETDVGSDLVLWVTLLIFARTFCHWEEAVAAQLDWDSLVKAAAPVTELVQRGVGCGRVVQTRVPMQGAKLGVAERIRNALFALEGSVKGAITGIGLLDELNDRLHQELMFRARDAARASAIRSATLAAQRAALQAAEHVQTQASYDAAWESSLDIAGLDDEVFVGRAGVSYIADHLSERGLPRSEHAESVRVLSQGSPDGDQNGWTSGCRAGWVIGWRAGRRAAKFFDWKDFGVEFPVGEWSDACDRRWEEAWDCAPISCKASKDPVISQELPGRGEYNAYWDAGWSVGWSDGFEVGRESEKEKAKRRAVKTWSDARSAAGVAAYRSIQRSLNDWLEGTPWQATSKSPFSKGYMKQDPQRQTNQDRSSPRRQWKEALDAQWNKGCGAGTLELVSACDKVAREVGKCATHSAYSPVVSINTLASLRGKAIEGGGYVHHELQSYLMHLINTQSYVDGAKFVAQVWQTYVINYIQLE